MALNDTINEDGATESLHVGGSDCRYPRLVQRLDEQPRINLQAEAMKIHKRSRILNQFVQVSMLAQRCTATEIWYAAFKAHMADESATWYRCTGTLIPLVLIKSNYIQANFL